jgi:hypothetical protein
MKHAKMFVIVGSLIGTAVVHSVLVACSSNSSSSHSGGGSNMGEPDAHAQEMPACKQWQVQSFLAPKFTFVTVPEEDGTPGDKISLPTFAPFSLPPGWEPISAGDFGAVTARHCLSQ